jgi:guanylate kinase
VAAVLQPDCVSDSPDKQGGTLFIISGPSGAGKGSLVDRVLGCVENLKLSISATTRPPRPGEQDGREYHFLSEQQFLDLADAGGFLEWAYVHGNRYGTLRSQVEDLLAAGDDMILEIDVQGREQIITNFASVVSVFVVPPSSDELERRLRLRGDAGDDIQIRMNTAKQELSMAEKYDHIIVNDDLELACEQLKHIICSYRK